MKKFLLLLCTMTCLMQPVFAKNVKVEAMSDFSTANPPAVWRLKVVEPFLGKNNFLVQNGCIIEGKITDVTEPQRLKRNASFVFIPVKFYDENGKVYDIERDLIGKYSVLSDISAEGVARQGMIYAGNKLVDGFFGPGIAIVEGAVKNEQGNRVKSSVVSLYESTPLSYCNKGTEVEIPKGKIFIMSFKDLDAVEQVPEKPNYEYTPINSDVK